VIVLTKRSLFDSATAYAQGGIAAALGAGDSPELHRRDTLAAGAALCDAAAVKVLVEEGPARVRELSAAGADFDLAPNGKFILGKEAAHSRKRIVHAHGDQTGAEVARTLIRRVTESPGVEVMETTRVLDLIVEGGECIGVRASASGQAVEIVADVTVLATGGCGQVYRYTTNPQVATGDGYAIALRSGVRLADMEFVQFHPTALATPENPLALISEAVRGEGAILLNSAGVRFMPERHRLAELAPRDIVAREIFREQESGGQVYLDAHRLGDTFEHRFPGIFALCRARGIDPRADLIPVTPAAHYMMGGVVTDLAGRSSLARLYACGEVSRTGVHGANRLASNSLLKAWSLRSEWHATSSRRLLWLPSCHQLRRGACRRSWIEERRRSPPMRSGASCGRTRASCEPRPGCASASSSSTTSRSGCPAARPKRPTWSIPRC
jgi:L-aspartate oxidase